MEGVEQRFEQVLWAISGSRRDPSWTDLGSSLDPSWAVPRTDLGRPGSVWGPGPSQGEGKMASRWHANAVVERCVFEQPSIGLGFFLAAERRVETDIFLYTRKSVAVCTILGILAL